MTYFSKMKEAQLVYIIGMILEIIGVALTFAFSPKLLPGTWLRQSNALTSNEKLEKYLVVLGFVLIIIGAFCQLFQAIVTYNSQYT